MFERNFQYPNLKNDQKRNCFKGISIPQLILGTPIPKNQNIIICYSFYKEANNGKNFVFGHLVSQQKRGKKRLDFCKKIISLKNKIKLKLSQIPST